MAASHTADIALTQLSRDVYMPSDVRILSLRFQHLQQCSPSTCRTPLPWWTPC